VGIATYYRLAAIFIRGTVCRPRWKLLAEFAVRV
jgi:hypothetical protein